jgi:hypothetical protein
LAELWTAHIWVWEEGGSKKLKELRISVLLISGKVRLRV